MGKQRQPLFGLIDCDQFYVSCERVFQPALKGKPVVVLSNNDGNIVARSRDYVELKVKARVV
ncbi:MAG: hypothetical protein QOH51_180 [Acidobacteriota bacterium]|jgi:DNA polymerase V|nr:hypothetical protein [Acidobacteriota bacterium]